MDDDRHPRRPGRPPTRAEPPTPPDPCLAQHLADLTHLRDRGLLHEAECERARRRLLGRQAP